MGVTICFPYGEAKEFSPHELIWVSTVMAELPTWGFPRDTRVPGASLCSFTVPRVFLLLSIYPFPHVTLVSVDHSVGNHSPTHRERQPKGRWSALTNCIARPDNPAECPSVSLVLFSLHQHGERRVDYWGGGSRRGTVSSSAPGCILCKETLKAGPGTLWSSPAVSWHMQSTLFNH